MIRNMRIYHVSQMEMSSTYSFFSQNEQINFRLTSCKVSSGDDEIYAIHDFGNEVCFDNSRKRF